MFLRRLKSCASYLWTYRDEIALGTAALILTDLVGLAIPWLIKSFIDSLPGRPESAEMLRFGFWVFLAAGLQMAFRYCWRRFLYGPSRKIEFDILNHLMSRFLNLDRAFYQFQKVGDLMSRATNDLRSVRDFMGMGLLVVVDCLVVISASTFLMFTINPRLALICLAPLPLVSLMFYKFTGEIGRRQQSVQEHLSSISSMVQENVAGIRVLHAFVQEEAEKRKFAELNREYIRKNLDLTRLYGIFQPALSTTLGVSALMALWLGGRAVIRDEITLGSFVAFNGYLLMLSWPMMGFGFVFTLTQRGLTSMGRIDEILDARPTIRDVVEAPPSAPVRGEIVFRDLSFRYPGAHIDSLSGITCRMEAGTCTAIIGMIGSGKSTLAGLVPRLYEAERGEIFLDGMPLGQYPLPHLRRLIGFVGQESFLFSASLRENIQLGDPEASAQALEEVVRLAGLEPDIRRFPNGLDTIVGERGVSLSGGQKQRIALARALVRKPSLLILDDAFSSLDVETEEKVLGNIRGYIRGITSIIISHRMSAVRGADQVIVLESGRIAESGTHELLMSRDGYYRRIYRNQMLAREMEMLIQ